MSDAMEQLQSDFAAHLAKQARADLEAAFDRALKRDITKRQRAALLNLREKSATALRYIEAGRNDRLPAAVLDEALSGIRDILNGAAKQAIAKAASGPGHRDAAGLHHDGLIPASLTGAKPEGEALVQACVDLAKEFRELAEHARKVMRKLGAEQDFDDWEKKYHKRIAEALLKQDLHLAQIEMTEARRALNALLDEARVNQVLGEPEKPMIPRRQRAH